MSEGLTGNLYEIKVLPADVEELVAAIFDQKGKDKLSRKDALDIAKMFDDRYHISQSVPSNN